MRFRRWLPLLLALLLCLTACGGTDMGEKSDYRLYFRSTEKSGPALIPEDYAGEDAPSPRKLLGVLLAGPTSAELQSPFPAGVTLRGLDLKEGILYVDLSEQYGGLTDAELTVADYAITLTLCQLDGVDGVCITVAGQPLTYRSHQILTPEEAILVTAQDNDEKSPDPRG